MTSLNNKTVLITGGTSGIGKAIATAFAKDGAKVIITGRRDAGDDIAKEIGADFIRCDVSKEQDVADSYIKAEEMFGKLDVVILNAGIAMDTQGIEDTPSSVMRALVETNLMGVFYGLKYAPKSMNDGGSIITTGSIAGSGFTAFGNAEYAASKAGVAYLSRTAAIEYAGRAIRVNTVAPATIAGTEMMAEDDGSPLAKFFSSFSALGRLGRQEEAVAVYRFLASDDSSYITGQEIRVDGGATAGVGMPIMNLIEKAAGF